MFTLIVQCSPIPPLLIRSSQLLAGSSDQYQSWWVSDTAPDSPKHYCSNEEVFSEKYNRLCLELAIVQTRLQGSRVTFKISYSQSPQLSNNIDISNYLIGNEDINIIDKIKIVYIMNIKDLINIINNTAGTKTNNTYVLQTI